MVHVPCYMYLYTDTVTRTNVPTYAANMARRGKQGDARYSSVSGRIPRTLRKQFKAKLADYDETLNVDIALERLIGLWVRGELEIGEPNPPRTPVLSEQFEPEYITQRKLASGEYTPEQRRAVWHLGEQDTPATSPEPSPPEPTKPKKQRSGRGGVIEFNTTTELGRLRAALGYTQQQLADALGVAKSTVARYERGKVNTPEHVLQRAQTLLHTDDSKND